MTASIEVVKNSYARNLFGSEMIGDVFGFFRNLAIDTI